jgi:hypothetical protein
MSNQSSNPASFGKENWPEQKKRLKEKLIFLTDALSKYKEEIKAEQMTNNETNLASTQEQLAARLAAL